MKTLFSALSARSALAACALGLTPLAAHAAGGPALEPGRYALVMEVVANTDVPVLGGVRSATRTLALVDLAPAPGGLTATQRVCDVELGGERQLARTVFPERLVRALPERTFDVRLGEGGMLYADLGDDALGYDPEKTNGSLPTAKDDPALIDVDQDARPGATLLLEVRGIGRFPLAVVSRGRTVLEGRVVAPGRAEGTARLTAFEQRVLEGMPVVGGVGAVEANLGESGFLLERVAPGTACKDISLGARGLGYRAAGG